MPSQHIKSALTPLRRLANPSSLLAGPPPLRQLLSVPALVAAFRRTRLSPIHTTGPVLKMKEAEIKRNPHPDFKSVESSRPDFDRSAAFHYTKTAAPNWAPGSGANDLPGAAAGGKKHITIDPYEDGRAPVHNYKLLISAIVPRPIAFVSTVSKDGATTNLAPFSYFQMVNHDPPLFVIGFASGLEAARDAKHTLHNLHETGECTINIISEHFVEAANATSVNAPYGASEWAVSGLTPGYDCETVKPARVKEAVFSIEGKLESVREFGSRSKPGKISGAMAVIEGSRFWVREDAINEERNIIDPAVSFLTLCRRPSRFLSSRSFPRKMPYFYVQVLVADVSYCIGSSANIEAGWRHLRQDGGGYRDPPAGLREGHRRGGGVPKAGGQERRRG